MRNYRATLFATTALAVVGTLSACSTAANGAAGASASPSASTVSATPSASAPEPSVDSSGTVSASPSVSLSTLTVDGVTVSGAMTEKPIVTVTPGQPAPTGLVAQDVVTGDGKAISANGTGTFNYTGVLFSDGTTFDSSWDRGDPITFPLNRVIPGWQQGLVGMQEGGRRLLIIPPDLAYGSQALPGIPPNSTLVFVVDLEKVN